jgi:hypothetical protein
MPVDASNPKVFGRYARLVMMVGAGIAYTSGTITSWEKQSILRRATDTSVGSCCMHEAMSDSRTRS